MPRLGSLPGIDVALWRPRAAPPTPYSQAFRWHAACWCRAMRDFALLALVVASCPACGGCIGVFPGIGCTAIAKSSVNVRLVDAQGAIAGDAVVTSSTDGGPQQSAICGHPTADGGCEEWPAGEQQAS